MEGPILSSGDLFTDAAQSAPFKKHFLERRASELGAEVVGSTAVNFSGPFVSFYPSSLAYHHRVSRASEASASVRRRQPVLKLRARDIACRAIRGGPRLGNNGVPELRIIRLCRCLDSYLNITYPSK